MLHLVVFLSFVYFAVGTKYRYTPHGKRLAQCVITHDEYEVIINEKENGVEAFYPLTNRTAFHPKLAECVEEAQNNIIGKLGAWQDNAYDSNTAPMGTFYSSINLPNENPPDLKQLLYYFIGMVNFGSTLGETIIQPVVNYDQSGQYPSGWSMEAWNCCPSGQTHESKNVKLPSDAVKIPNSCIADGSNINVTMSYNGASSTLIAKQGGRSFKYVDVTLEEYGVNSNDCQAFNKKVFNFTDMRLVDLTGKKYTPNWVIADNSAAKCRGSTILYDKFNIGIIGDGS